MRKLIFTLSFIVFSLYSNAQGNAIAWGESVELEEVSETGYINYGTNGWQDGYLVSEQRGFQVGSAEYYFYSEDYASWEGIPFKISLGTSDQIDQAVDIFYFDGSYVNHNSSEILSISNISELTLVLNHLGNVEVYNGSEQLYTINSVLSSSQSYYVFINLLYPESFLATTFTETVLSAQSTSSSTPVSSNCQSLSAEKYVEEIAYDKYGNEISRGLQVLGDFDQVEMSMRKNYEANEVLAKQVIYDNFGRPIIESLEAPINQSSFCIDETFMFSVDQEPISSPASIQPYSVLDVENANGIPDAISHQSTLGAFYSGYTDDIARSDYPFAKLYYKDDIYNTAISTGGYDQRFFNSENRSFTFPAVSANELVNLFGANQSHIKRSSADGIINTQLATEFTLSQLAQKSINITKENEAVITYTTLSGDILATALSGNTNPCEVQKARIEMHPGVLTTIHVPDGHDDALALEMPDPTLIYQSSQGTFPMNCFDVIIVDQLSGSILTAGTDYSIVQDAQKSVIQNIVLLGGYASGQQVLGVSVAFNENALSHGVWKNYLRVVKYGGLKTFLNYELDYHEWTLYYYDVLGNVIEVVQPEGVDCSVDASNYFQFNDQVEIRTASTTGISQVDDLVVFPIAVPSGNTINEASLCLSPLYVDKVISNNLSGERLVRDQSVYSALEPETEGDPPVAVVIGTADIYAESDSPSQNRGKANPNGFISVSTIKVPPAAGSLVVKDIFEKKFTFEVVGRPAVGQDVVLLEKTFKIEHEEIQYFDPTTFNSNGTGGQSKVWRQDGSVWVQLDIADYYKFDDGDISAATLSNYKSIVVRVKSVFSKEWRDTDDLTPSNEESKPSSYTALSFFNFAGNIGLRVNSFPSPPSHNEDVIEFYGVNHEDGTVSQKQIPDEDLTQYLYDKEGRVKFSQNAVQAANNTFSYVLYDFAGRVWKTGQYDNNVSGGEVITFGISDPQNPAASHTFNLVGDNSTLNGLNTEYETFFFYDEVQNDYPTGLSGDLSTQNNVVGRLAKTSNENTSTWYSYDYLGRLEHLVQYSADLGVHTISYSYNHLGKTVAIAYDEQDASSSYFVKFLFNKDQQLARIMGSNKASTNFKALATYDYDILGRLKRKELGNKAQGIDYYYTISGKLKGINNAFRPETDPDYIDVDAYEDLFAETLHYYEGDYQNANVSLNSIADNSLSDRLDGTIKAVTWYTRSDIALSQSIGNRPTYSYEYDVLGQLTGASLGNIATGLEFGYTNSAPATYVSNSANAYGTSYDYDGNGNIVSLSRRSGTGTLFDQLTYNYPKDAGNQLTGNQLLYITDASSSSGISDEIQSQLSDNYQYDERGQLEIDKERDVKLAYTPGGLVEEVKNASGTQLRQKNFYDDRGNLFKKENYVSGSLSNTEYWWYDLSGSPIQYFKEALEANPVLKESYIYSDGRLATYTQLESSAISYQFSIKDHIGNVRASLSETHSQEGAWDFTQMEDEGGWGYSQNEGDPDPYVDGNGWNIEGEHALFKYIISLGSGHFAFNMNLAQVATADLTLTVLDANNQSLASSVLEAGNMGQSLQFHLATAQVCTLKVECLSTGVQSFIVESFNLSSQVHQVLSYRDYYPYGWVLPGRVYEASSEGNQFQYQGDFTWANEILNWSRFEVRNFDSRIGRWLSIDPKGQYFSLYKGMGNNPISIYDPDGAWGYRGEDGNVVWLSNVYSPTVEINGEIFKLIAVTVIDFNKYIKYHDVFDLGNKTLTESGYMRTSTPEEFMRGLNEDASAEMKEVAKSNQFWISFGMGFQDRLDDYENFIDNVDKVSTWTGVGQAFLNGTYSLSKLSNPSLAIQTITPLAVEMAGRVADGNGASMMGYASGSMAIDFGATAGLGGAYKGLGYASKIRKAPLALKVSKRITSGITSTDGFLFGGVTIRTPFNISVQRFGSMSRRNLDCWGLRIGTSEFANRTFAAIKPKWNPLTQYTLGVIPKGTPIKFGIIGPQGWKYPGGALQFRVQSKSVINQSSILIPR